MKKEDLQSSQEGTGSSENKGNGRQPQKNQATSISNEQQEDNALRAGLGRDRMTDIEDLGGLSGRDNYAGGDNDDMSRVSTNRLTDR